MDGKIYNETFHEGRDLITRHTAEVVSELFLKEFNIKSVCDVGGGLGTWLDVFREKIGKESFNGALFDGNYIPKENLITPELFVPVDLEVPIEVKGHFDLAICLEVAEHIKKERAYGLVKELCSLADIVLFSAAIPLQGGEGHVNENTFEFWRKLFEKNGYFCNDMIRPYINQDEKIPFWYKNNIFVYCKENIQKCNNKFLDFVTMDIYMQRVKEIENLRTELALKNKEKVATILHKICRKIKRIWKR